MTRYVWLWPQHQCACADRTRTYGFNLVYTPSDSLDLLSSECWGKGEEMSKTSQRERQIEAGATSATRLRGREPATRDQPQSRRLGRATTESGSLGRGTTCQTNPRAPFRGGGLTTEPWCINRSSAYGLGCQVATGVEGGASRGCGRVDRCSLASTFVCTK